MSPPRKGNYTLGIGAPIGNDRRMESNNNAPATASSETGQPTHDPLTGAELAPATPAATIIVFREQPGLATPELLMVERSSSMVFAAGAAVFPGGRVDADDHELAARMGGADDPDEAAARVAAIRETVEETGLGIGFTRHPSRDELAHARRLLHEGQAFSAICAEAGWRLDLEQLVPFTRWRPPFNERRVFDTRFYLARDHGEDHAIAVDETENRHLFWASASDVLARADRQEVKIIFPTRRNLERLAMLRSFDEAVAHARAYPPRLVVPFIAEREDGPHLCIADDLGYPVTSEPLRGAMRG